MTGDRLDDFLSRQLADIGTGWSFGTFGAIAEFTRSPGEEFILLQHNNGQTSIVTARGGLRVTPCTGLRLIASESPTKDSWSHRVALCLPRDESAMSGRTELTELGRDAHGIRAQDRESILFDLGLGTFQVDVCVRTSDPGVVASLRRNCGKAVFDPASDAMPTILSASPHRVFLTRVGRAEVFQPIPSANGKSPDGPHTHVLPKLLSHRRTHAATEHLPESWTPCAHFYPPHPLRHQSGQGRPFQYDHHAAFQTLLECFGDTDLVAVKKHIANHLRAGHDPSTLELPSERFARATMRVAVRQLLALEQASSGLAAGLAAFDGSIPTDPGDPMEALH